jgi:undecaprenyl pyrophosphate phosphatase UppP
MRNATKCWASAPGVSESAACVSAVALMASEYVMVAWKFYLAMACVFGVGALLSGSVCWWLGFCSGWKQRDRDYWA